MGPEPSSNDPGDTQRLSTRPGNHAGWSVPRIGPLACRQTHEVDRLLPMPNGVLVGYCVRCDARFEAPWVPGGTAAALALQMASEALTLGRPDPSVRNDLEQVASLLSDDANQVIAALKAVQAAHEAVGRRLRDG